MSRNSLEEYDEEYDEEHGLINIETPKKPFTIIYKFIMISLSVFFLLALYYKLVLYITNKDKIVDCNDESLYLCGILVFPFLLLFSAVNEFISGLKNIKTTVN
tara:strand:- start:60 stop:368 length:309 start_codon:yes stop_codon:yes gene_type:complete